MAERKTGAQMDTGISAVDLSDKNRCFCRRTDTGINLATNGGLVAGVIIEGKVAGLHTSFATGNQVQVIAAAALTVGTKVSSNASGHAKVATAGEEIVGFVTVPAGAAGELATIEIDRSKI